MTVEELVRNLLARMGEIERDHVSKSLYRDLAPGEQDEPPDGDAYNLLWDAILDEIHAAWPGLSGAEVKRLLGRRNADLIEPAIQTFASGAVSIGIDSPPEVVQRADLRPDPWKYPREARDWDERHGK
jgi:hypothetical protein